ncbi:glycoside hydrolase family 32 protein [Paenibacillus sp. D51F]
MTNARYEEKFRPQFHFTPEANWMNDPNGMVYFEGEYHLFYQYYPGGTTWGPMHWGHAVSPDMVHWEHLPIALEPDENGFIFSGSAVVDWQDSSGLFSGGAGLVAVFTHHDTDPRTNAARQRQSIAYSLDKGRTWIKYAGNPVLTEEGILDFRDPKVFWHADSERWVMVLAAGDHIRFYASPDLKAWSFTSEFGLREGSHEGVWECPDLFELPIDGDPGKKKWVLIVSIGDHPDSPEGSRTQYFVGEFDGRFFVNDHCPETVLWVDHGRDNYAGVTWSDIPDEDGRRIYIGWMSNWKYANVTPTASWRSAMTIPRVLSLARDAEGVRLRQNAVQELQKLRLDPHRWEELPITPAEPFDVGIGGDQLEISMEIELGEASLVGLKLRTSAGEETIIGYDSQNACLFVDRSASGIIDFHPQFACRHEAGLQLDKGVIRLDLYLDRSSVEVFADGGKVAMTDLIFPDPGSNGFQVFSEGGAAKIVSLNLYSLNSIYSA